MKPLFIVVALLFSCIANASLVTSQSFNFNVARGWSSNSTPEFGSSARSFVVDGFDTSLGTLTGVEFLFDFAVEYSGTIDIENNRTCVFGSCSVSGNGSADFLSLLQVTQSGTMDFYQAYLSERTSANCSGRNRCNSTRTELVDYDYSVDALALLGNAFFENGSFDFKVTSSVSNLVCSGPRCQFSGLNRVGGNLTINYAYTAPVSVTPVEVPEPKPVAILAAGLLLIYVLRKVLTK